MKLLTLLQCEMLKLKRSQVLLMTLLCPLAVVGLQFLIALDNGGKMITEKGWGMYWSGTVSLWYMLMLPLYVALITTLINGLEHKYAGWRVMATMPIKQWQLFVAKALLAWLFVILASIVMYALTSASIFGLTLVGFDSQDAFSSPFFENLARVMFAIIPIVLIGHIVSWRTKNIVLPLALGVVMTITGVKAVNSEKYWIFDPWTYHLTSTMVSNPDVQQTAIITAVSLGAVLLIGGATWLNRREIHA
jgi:hypothetical protein